MLSNSISTVLTPVFLLLLFCFTAFKSSIIALPGPTDMRPCNAGCCGSAQKSAPSPGFRQISQNLPPGSTCDPSPANWPPAYTPRPEPGLPRPAVPQNHG